MVHGLVGGDRVALKSGWDRFGINYATPSSDATLRKPTCGGDSAGGIAIGSETSGGVENVLADSIHFDTVVNRPVSISSTDSRGG